MTKGNVKIGTLFPTLLEKKRRSRKPCWVEQNKMMTCLFK